MRRLSFFPLTGCVLLSACGKLSDEVEEPSPLPPPVAQSTPESAFEAQAVAPHYRLYLDDGPHTNATLWATAEFENRELLPSATIRVNGTLLDPLVRGSKSGPLRSYEASIPIAANDTYVFTLDAGARLYQTEVKLPFAKLLAGDHTVGPDEVVKFKSPFVVAWDKDLDHPTVDLDGCFAPSSLTTARLVTARTATFFVTPAPCDPKLPRAKDVYLTLRMSEELPLDLGAPFKLGITERELFVATSFDLTF